MVGSCEQERSCTHCGHCQCSGGPIGEIPVDRHQPPTDHTAGQHSHCSNDSVAEDSDHVEGARRSLEKVTLTEPTSEVGYTVVFQDLAFQKCHMHA